MINAFRFWHTLKANPETEWKKVRVWFFSVVYNEGLAMLRKDAGIRGRAVPISEYTPIASKIDDEDQVDLDPYSFIDLIVNTPGMTAEELDARRSIGKIVKLAIKKKGEPLILSCLGYEHREVAKMLGTTLPAVKSRTNRAREIIRERYEAA